MSTEFETPSKPLANGLSHIDLASKQTSSATLNAKLQQATTTPKIVMNGPDGKVAEGKTAQQEQDEQNELEESRKKFVGEVDLPESEEPLLKETKSRFVLFPIKYREVSFFSLLDSVRALLTQYLDA
jgi:hypothetical protein